MGSGGSMAPCTASRESLRRLFFFQQFWPKFSSAPEVMNLFLKEKKLQRSKFPILKKSMRCLDSVGEVGTQTRDPSPTFLSFIWHTSCQMRPVSDVMRQNREALSDVRPALCSDHCGRRFWFGPKATFYPCVIAFQNAPSYLRPWSSMALDKTKNYMNDKHFMPFKIFLFFVQCKRA